MAEWRYWSRHPPLPAVRRCLPPELQRKVTYEALSADEALEDGEADDCEVLIVDPPRKVS